MRPVLKPALRPLWRDATTLQLGLDPRHAVVLQNVSPAHARFLALMDGSRERGALLVEATGYGLDHTSANALLDLLAERHALDDATAGSVADRLLPDAAHLSLVEPAPGAAAAALAARAGATVAIAGIGRVATATRDLLLAAGVGQVRQHEPSRDGVAASAGGEDAAVVVVAPGPAAVPHPSLLALLGERRTPHLLAQVRETVGVVGPFVLPGVTSCVRCHDLARAERDPAWPVLAAQLTEPSRHRVAACDIVLATLVASLAAAQVLAHVEGRTVACLDATLEARLPEARLRRRTWGSHPDCGCATRHQARSA